MARFLQEELVAGTPFKRALLLKIKERGGWAWVLDQIASGKTLLAVAVELGVSRQFLSHVLNKTQRLRPLLAVAKKEAAAAHADAGLALLDDAPETRDGVAKAKAQADYRRWLAEVYDREVFGAPAKDAVKITVNQLHLDALRARPAPPVLPDARPILPSGTVAPPVQEAVIVSEESAA